MPRIGTENQRPGVTAFVCGIERLMATVDSFSCSGGLWPLGKILSSPVFDDPEREFDPATMETASGRTLRLAGVALLFSRFGVGCGVSGAGAPSLSLLACL